MNKRERLEWLPQIALNDMAEAANLDASCHSREELTRAYQEIAGLEVDGWPGVMTAQALYGSGVPIPRNRTAVERAVSDGDWCTTGRGRGVEWVTGRPDVTRVRLYDGAKVRLWQPIADEFERLYDLAVHASGYHPKSVAGYVPRVIGGTDRLSMHAYGIAVDFDPRDNPWGGRRNNGSPSLMRQHPMFHEVFEWAGWTWGGRWRGGRGDDMHFQRAGV